MVFHPDIVIKQKIENKNITIENQLISESSITSSFEQKAEKTSKTTIPFLRIMNLITMLLQAG